ncbi:MAG: site-specific integrase [Prevotella sp.]|nr:site-specific integrase [Prevotella sp.]
MDKKIKSCEIDVVARVKEYREPEACWGKDCVTVSFYAFDPERGTLRRKRVKLNRELKCVKGKRAQREFVQGVVDRLRDELKAGWNPWIQQSESLVYARWEDACERYKAYLVKQQNEHNMRPESVASYMSYQRVLMRWVSAERKNVRYAYQFDRRLVDAFLDYVYLDKDNSIQTRNNYLSWIKSFSTWMLGKCYIEQDPTQGIPRMKIKRGSKNRDVIPDGVLQQIHDYLEKHNKHFLLACYLLHYLFVRPHEIAQLKIEDFSLSRKTLLIHGDVAKNWQDAVVTLPMHVIELMLDLDVFRSPGRYYLFSDGFKPGEDFRSEKFFRDYWTRVLRKELKFSDRYKFYSLKDTGITNMLRANTDVLSVRDQARHSSILITDIYTPKDIKEANKLLVNYRGVL